MDGDSWKSLPHPPNNWNNSPTCHSYCSVSHVQFCYSMDCSTPEFPVLQYLPEFAKTHIHWVGDAIQPSHPLSSPSPPALNLSQHQGLFQWVGPLHQVTKLLEFSASASVLPMNIQGWLLLELSGLIFCSLRDSQESSPAPKFKSINSLALSLLYGPTLSSTPDYWKNHSFD